MGSTAVRLSRRRVHGRLAHRATLLGAGGLALVVGVGVGAALDAVGPAGGEASVTPEATVATSPEVCAAAQVAWSRAASAQVQMDAESPGTLRQGFVVARDALAAATPPNAVASEWETVSTYVTTVADAAQAAGKGEVGAAVATSLAGLDTPAMTAASKQVTTHLAEDCRL